MRRASVRTCVSLAPLALIACGGTCDAPFHLSYFDERIAPTHEFVRSDGRHIFFGEYEFDEFEDGGTVAAAWFGTLDQRGEPTSGSHFGGISWMGDVWQRDDERYVMLINDDQAAPLLAELDRDAGIVEVHVLDLVMDYGYPPNTPFELWGSNGGEGSDDAGYLIYVPDKLARLRADLSTAWFMDLRSGDRAAVAGEQTFLAREVSGGIVVDRIDAEASSQAQVRLSSSEVALKVVAITSSQGQPVMALASTDAPGSMFVVRLSADLELRYQVELLSYGADPGFVACFDDGRCAFSSWDGGERHVSTLFLDADGATVATLGYEARAPLQRLRGRRDHLMADHELPVGGPVAIRADAVDGCLTSSFEPSFTFGERQLGIETSKEALSLQQEELVSESNPNHDQPEETEELTLPPTCQ